MANEEEAEPFLGGSKQDGKAVRNHRIAIIAVVVVFAVLLAGIGVLIYFVARPTSSDEANAALPDLQQAVTVPGIMKHLEEFQTIAFNHPNRSRSVLNAYNQSADYVANILAMKTDCDITIQYFKVPVGEEVATPILAQVAPYNIRYVPNVDFRNYRYSNSANGPIVGASIQFVPNSGCSDADYANFTSGSIALVQSPSNSTACPLVDRSFRAENFNASAIIVFGLNLNSALSTERARIVDWKEGDRLVQIPVISASNSFGNSIINILNSQTEPVIFNLQSNTRVVIADTSNVICTSKTGLANRTVVFGAHLDSVPEGPGINDDGSGSATMLETVVQIYKQGINPTNKFVFGWWGAEEIGLLGSRHYVRELQNDQEAFSNVVMNLNFDMLASPNFNPYIHNGATAPNVAVRDASVRLQKLFEKYFKTQDLPFILTDLVSGSDFLPFIEAGIPSGGVLTGAGGIKTEEQRRLIGGLANAQYDPCYHQSCDTVDNINREALRQNSQAAAQVIQKILTSKDILGFLQGNADIDA